MRQLSKLLIITTIAVFLSLTCTVIVAKATSGSFSWNGFNVSCKLNPNGHHAATATTKITNISAPAAYNVTALVNAKQSADGSGSILKQSVDVGYNFASAYVYHAKAKSFVSVHNIKDNNGSVAKSLRLTDYN